MFKRKLSYTEIAPTFGNFSAGPISLNCRRYVMKENSFSGKYKRYGQEWEQLPSGVWVPTANISDISVRSKVNYLGIKARAIEIEKFYADAGVRLDARSGLGQLIKAAKELSDNWLLGNRDRLNCKMLFQSMHLDRVSDAILLLSSETGKNCFLKKLKSGTLDFFTREKSVAKDTLWELEVWAKLRKRINTVYLEEPPDVVVHFNKSSIGISCKKLYSESHVQNILSKAVNQIEQKFEFGIVAINLDDLLPPDVVLKMDSSDAVTERLNDINTNFINKHIRHFTHYFEKSRIISAIVSTSILTDIPNERPRFRNTSQWTIWTVAELSQYHKAQLKKFYKVVMT